MVEEKKPPLKKKYLSFLKVPLTSQHAKNRFRKVYPSQSSSVKTVITLSRNELPCNSFNTRRPTNRTVKIHSITTLPNRLIGGDRNHQEIKILPNQLIENQNPHSKRFHGSRVRLGQAQISRFNPEKSLRTRVFSEVSQNANVYSKGHRGSCVLPKLTPLPHVLRGQSHHARILEILGSNPLEEITEAFEKIPSKINRSPKKHDSLLLNFTLNHISQKLEESCQANNEELRDSEDDDSEEDENLQRDGGSRNDDVDSSADDASCPRLFLTLDEYRKRYQKKSDSSCVSSLRYKEKDYVSSRMESLSVKEHDALATLCSLGGGEHFMADEEDTVSGRGSPAAEVGRSGKKRRGNLPKESVNILKSWLKHNRYNPYPTDDDKIQLASQAKLTQLQVCNWFINARRRLLPDILKKEGHVAAHFTMQRRTKKMKIAPSEGKADYTLDATSHQPCQTTNIGLESPSSELIKVEPIKPEPVKVCSSPQPLDVSQTSSTWSNNSLASYDSRVPSWEVEQRLQRNHLQPSLEYSEYAVENGMEYGTLMSGGVVVDATYYNSVVSSPEGIQTVHHHPCHYAMKDPTIIYTPGPSPHFSSGSEQAVYMTAEYPSQQNVLLQPSNYALHTTGQSQTPPPTPPSPHPPLHSIQQSYVCYQQQPLSVVEDHLPGRLQHNDEPRHEEELSQCSVEASPDQAVPYQLPSHMNMAITPQEEYESNKQSNDQESRQKQLSHHQQRSSVSSGMDEKFNSLHILVDAALGRNAVFGDDDVTDEALAKEC